MMHWFVVAHLDPLDPMDKSAKPYRPKSLRPISREALEGAEFGSDIHEFFSVGDGCVYCDWSNCGEWFARIRDFACFLARREGAIVIDERWMVWWPIALRPAQSRPQSDNISGSEQPGKECRRDFTAGRSGRATTCASLPA